MPTINIPEVFKPTLDRIVSMPDDELGKVREVLAGLKVHLKPELITEQVKAAGSKVRIADLHEIVETLISLSITRFRADVPLDDFVKGVVRSLSKTVPANDRAKAEEKLKSLLSIEPLVLSGRAFDLQHEYEKVFRGARIITDIRPVFSLSGTDAIGAMIVHNLSVEYSQSGERKQIVFALDDADVASLKKLLERAEAKSKTLEQLISKTDVKYFESR